MRAITFDKNGNKEQDTSLHKEVFGVIPNAEALLQYVRVYRANQRQGTQSTKTRGEVQGSAAKPWAQKHTGRARAGEKRNPIWRHGGIAHGPKPRDWGLKVSAQIRNLALRSILSVKAAEDKVFVSDKLAFEKISVKAAVDYIKNTGLKGKTLLVLGSDEQKITKSFSNLTSVKAVTATEANTFDFVNSNNVIFEKQALDYIEKKLRGSN